MCGISGILAPRPADLPAQLASMLRAQAHRGPDAEGSYHDRHVPLALGHNRLAIHDLTPAGAQPMTSSDGRWVVVLNGEIYNFEALRSELQHARPMRFRGTSDTEVLVEYLSLWGLDHTLSKIDGMFAFAAWDSLNRKLYLVRDRMGEKPLYYGFIDGSLVFASELGAIAAATPARLPLNPDALPLFLQYSYVPAPHTVYAQVFKLEPAHYLAFSARDPLAPVAHVQYWRVTGQRRADPAVPAEDMQSHFHDLLREEVGLQMSADVPLGAFLSGGIDSSLVVALMQAQASRPVKTFTIGFEDPSCNEAPYADAVARHLGTDHTTQIIGHRDAQAVIPLLPAMFGEPFADASQIPTYLVAKLARQSVTVSLSGDGGDESFGGYNRYFIAQSLLAKMGRIPLTARRGIAGMLQAPPPRWWDLLLRLAGQGSRPGAAVTGDKIHKLAQVLQFSSADDLYAHFVMQFPTPQSILADKRACPVAFRGGPFASHDAFSRMMEIDTLNYLPDDILTKVDRATMAVSLESRAPLLSRRVVECAWSLPAAAKGGSGTGKRILRDTLKRYVPEALFERPKVGFGVPLDKWLRAGLRDWAEALLAEPKLAQAGFDPAAVRQLWAEHLSGRRNWQYKLWPILMWQAWLEAQGRL